MELWVLEFALNCPGRGQMTPTRVSAFGEEIFAPAVLTPGSENPSKRNQT